MTYTDTDIAEPIVFNIDEIPAERREAVLKARMENQRRIEAFRHSVEDLIRTESRFSVTLG